MRVAVRGMATKNLGGEQPAESSADGRRSCDGDCYLRINSVASEVPNLGPAPATVLWVQGCVHRPCRQCMSPETWNPQAGVRARVVDIAAWLELQPSRNLTISGGEPVEQAGPLNALLDRLDGEWVVTVYTGHDLDALRPPATSPSPARPDVTELLDRIDLLIAGPYLPERHASLLWRGSDNQVIHELSGRATLPDDDRTAGVTFHMNETGLETIGVPPAPGFLRILNAEARQRGIRLRRPDEPRTFPFAVEES